MQLKLEMTSNKQRESIDQLLQQTLTNPPPACVSWVDQRLQEAGRYGKERDRPRLITEWFYNVSDSLYNEEEIAYGAVARPFDYVETDEVNGEFE